MASQAHSSKLCAPLVRLLRWLLLALAAGLAAGVLASGFLWLLSALYDDAVSRLAPLTGDLVLVLGGMVAGYLVQRYAQDAPGQALDGVIRGYREQDGNIPLRSALAKAVATIISVGVGGSAGRVGPAAHVGAAATSWIGRTLRLSVPERRLLLIAGCAAGFAASTRAPVAAAVFGVEVLWVGRAAWLGVLPAVVASVVATGVAIVMQAPPLPLSPLAPTALSAGLGLRAVALGAGAGLVALLYVEGLRGAARLFAWGERWLRWPPFAVAGLGGGVLALLALVAGRQYLSLSRPLLGKALAGKAVVGAACLWKIAFTSVTLGSGFSGGVVKPAFVVGATFGDAAASLLHMAPALAAALALSAVFGAAINTPVAAVVMAFELFGPVPGVLAILAVLPAYAVIGRRGALLGQDVGARKLRRGRPAAPRCGTPEEPPPTATPGGPKSRAERESAGELAGRR